MFWVNSTGNDRRILIIPNYTYNKDIEKDSFIDVIYSHIKSLEGADWILPIPKGKRIPKLNLPNVKLVECDISGNMIWMRSNLPLDIIKLLKDEKYDVVYSHLPDWAIGRYTNVDIIGYSHWWEMPECNGESWLNRSLHFPHEVINVLDYKVCFLNTHQQKEMVMENARKFFNDDIVQKLDEILMVMHLGVKEERIAPQPSMDYDKVIVFNHRTEKYKGWDKFYEWIRKYREHRTDFKVWAPLLDKPTSESWIESYQLPKEQYYEMLSRCCVCVQPKQLHAGWSVSATDCMMVGTPVLFGNQPCFFEIDSDAYTFDDYKDLKRKLDWFLDNRNFRMERGEIGLESVKKLVKNDSNNVGILRKNLFGS